MKHTAFVAEVAKTSEILHSCRNSRRVPLRQSVPRGAYSLIELVTVIAMISAVMTSSTLLFVTMMRAERNTSIAVVEQQTLSRLATQFRRDAHQAETATVTAEPDGTVELKFASGTAEPTVYRITAERLERLAPTAEGPHREVFRIRRAVWAFEPPAAGGRIAALTLQVTDDPSLPQPVSSGKSWRIEAGLSLTPPLPAKGGGS